MVVNASHEEQVAAITKIVANLFEQTVPNVTVLEPRSAAPIVLNFQLADSRFRYLMFCLATVHAVCARRMKRPDAVLNDCAYRIVSAAVSYQGSDGIFREPVDAQKAANEGAGYLGDYLDRWSAYIEITKGGNVHAGTSLVASMLQETESLSAATANDGSRLWPLAEWIEGRFDEIQRAFGELTEGSKNATSPSAVVTTGPPSSVSTESWLCSECGRRVPGRIDRCRCGRSRSENRSQNGW